MNDFTVVSLLQRPYEEHFYCTYFHPICVLRRGGEVALERTLFVLPVIRSKLELFLMRPVQAKFFISSNNRFLSSSREDTTQFPPVYVRAQ